MDIIFEIRIQTWDEIKCDFIDLSFDIKKVYAISGVSDQVFYIVIITDITEKKQNDKLDLITLIRNENKFLLHC